MLQIEQQKLMKEYVGSLSNFLTKIDDIDGLTERQAFSQLLYGNHPIVRMYKDGELLASSTKKDVTQKGALHIRPIGYRIANSVKHRSTPGNPLTVFQVAEQEGWDSIGNAMGLAVFHTEKLSKLGILKKVGEIDGHPKYLIGKTRGFIIESRYTNRPFASYNV